ncbi:TPA: MFS transporter, partial [Candidatus Bipolaricaulota bacterium]|nr:MFS transporter [Candidatus Bipolaricaulota bacterium]
MDREGHFEHLTGVINDAVSAESNHGLGLAPSSLGAVSSSMCEFGFTTTFSLASRFADLNPCNLESAAVLRRITLRRPLFALIEAVRLDRDLRLIMLSNFLWSSGSMLYYFIWPIYVRDLGGTAREIGLLTSLMFFTITITLVPGGVLADRFNRKWLILTTWIVATPAPLVYALARSWEGLIPGVIIYSFFLGWPAFEAYIAQASPPERLSRAYALTSAGFSLGAVLAPLLGAYLLPLIGIRPLFLISFSLFAASTAVLFSVSPQRPAGAGRSRTHIQDLVRLIKDRRFLRWLLLFALATLGASIVRPFVPTLLQDRYGLARPTILMASALLALGELALAVGLGWIADR